MEHYSNIMMEQVITAAIALFLLFNYPSPTVAASASSLVDGVCKKTINYADCISAIGSLSASDLKALARVSLGEAATNTTSSKAEIEKLANDKGTSPTLVPALKQCINAYEAAAGSFNSAKLEIDEDLQTANYDAKVAADGAQVCGDAVKATKTDVPLVTARNYYLSLYSSIGDLITSQLDDTSF